MNSDTINRTRSVSEWFLIVAFVVGLWLPVTHLIITRTGGSTEGHEKRQLTPPPPLPRTLANTWQYPDKFAAYYRDQFGFRANLIRWHALLLYRTLHQSPSGDVLIGRDDWLWYADDYSLEDYHSRQPFKREELELWRRTLEERQTWLAKRGIRFLLVLACDKYMIYPEYLPTGMQRPAIPYRVDELAGFLRDHSSIPVVALHEPLLAAKAGDRLYQRTDSHWNDHGAYVGYREIMNRLHDWFPTVAPLPLSSFEPRTVTTEGWDLARMMGLDDIIPEEDLQLVPRTPRRARVVDVTRPDPKWNIARIVMGVDDASLPSVMVFRDSFGSALVPFLAEHFRHSTFLWQYDFETKYCDNPKPDVVLLLITSRRMLWYQPMNPPGVAANLPD
jgi:alginate O-acetyltransferase complex protein AlgJ